MSILYGRLDGLRGLDTKYENTGSSGPKDTYKKLLFRGHIGISGTSGISGHIGISGTSGISGCIGISEAPGFNGTSIYINDLLKSGSYDFNRKLSNDVIEPSEINDVLFKDIIFAQ